jgi:hypothetical protein
MSILDEIRSYKIADVEQRKAERPLAEMEGPRAWRRRRAALPMRCCGPRAGAATG